MAVSALLFFPKLLLFTALQSLYELKKEFFNIKWKQQANMQMRTDV